MDSKNTSEKVRAGRNRTLTLNQDEIPELKSQLLTQEQLQDLAAAPDDKAPLESIINRTINADLLKAVDGRLVSRTRLGHCNGLHSG